MKSHSDECSLTLQLGQREHRSIVSLQHSSGGAVPFPSFAVPLVAATFATLCLCLESGTNADRQTRTAAQVARGVDLSRVNLVANLDLPRDAATYMHRVGRTGRYGTRGVAVTFVTPAELERLRADLETVSGGRVRITH